ncbi:energy transducer TonB [Paraburkholderia phytofirmans]|uniref:energy transducer TonB n=1 Tax=Paraburkholderia phytofirmans TaxID=261302 RepID=UPI0038BC6D76
MKRTVITALLAVASAGVQAQAPRLSECQTDAANVIAAVSVAQSGVPLNQALSNAGDTPHARDLINEGYRIAATGRAAANKGVQVAIAKCGGYSPKSSVDVGSAPLHGYVNNVRLLVRRRIEWDGPTSGLETVIAVHCAPSGTLLSATVQHGSGNAQWDAAALKAVRNADPMPTDSDGRAPAAFTITLRPVG